MLHYGDFWVCIFRFNDCSLKHRIPHIKANRFISNGAKENLIYMNLCFKMAVLCGWILRRVMGIATHAAAFFEGCHAPLQFIFQNPLYIVADAS